MADGARRLTRSEFFAQVDLSLPDGVTRYPTLDDYTAALEDARRRDVFAAAFPDCPCGAPLSAPPREGVTPMTVEKAQPWQVGDPCPASGGELVRYRPPTPEEYAASVDRENPRTLPARVDSASPAFIAEHGELWVCEQSGYRARVLPAAADDAPKQRAKARKADTGE